MNKKWTVEISDVALKSLKKLDKQTVALIFGYIEKRIANCEDPRSFGKPLVANHSGKWRYRVGDYRILCMIEDDRVVITVIEIGHRKDIYKL